MSFSSRYTMGTLLVAGGLGIACGVLPSAFKTGSVEGILLSSDSLDFGTAELFDKPRATLRITNPQPSEITVLLDADCSCVELSQNAFSIKPGETAAVGVQLRRMAAGEVRDGYRPIQRDLTVKYPLQGTRRSKSVLLTGQFFEPLVVDPAACDVRVKPFEPGNASISFSAQVDMADIEVLQRPAWCRAAKIDWNSEFQAGHLRVSLEPFADTRPLEGEIKLGFSYRQEEQRETATLRIPLRARVDVPISLDPPMLTFHAGERERQDVRVQLGILLRDQANARIVEVDSSLPELRCELDEESPESFSAHFAGTEERYEDSEEVNLKIVLESPEHGPFKVPLSLPVIVL